MKFRKILLAVVTIALLLMVFFGCKLFPLDASIIEGARPILGSDTMGVEMSAVSGSTDTRNITNETEIRRWGARLAPALINSTNIYLHSDNTVHLQFEIATYATPEDIAVYFELYNVYDPLEPDLWAEGFVTDRFKVPASAMRVTEGSYELFKGSNIRQNIIEVNYDVALSSTEIAELQPYMIARFRIYNIPFQSGRTPIYGFDIANTASGLFIPKISSTKLHSTNGVDGYEQHFSQDSVQRIMLIDTSSRYSHTGDCGATSSPLAYDLELIKNTGALPNSAELEFVRDEMKQTFATLLYSSNTSLNGSSLNLDFKVNSYSSPTDIGFKVAIYNKDFEQVDTIQIDPVDITVQDALYSITVRQYNAAGTTILAVQKIPQQEYSINKTVSLASSKLAQLSNHFYYRVFMNHTDLQNGLVLNGKDITNVGFNVYIPNLKSEQLGSGNTLVSDTMPQAYMQRFIKIPSSNQEITLNWVSDVSNLFTGTNYNLTGQILKGGIALSNATIGIHDGLSLTSYQIQTNSNGYFQISGNVLSNRATAIEFIIYGDIYAMILNPTHDNSHANSIVINGLDFINTSNINKRIIIKDETGAQYLSQQLLPGDQFRIRSDEYPDNYIKPKSEFHGGGAVAVGSKVVANLGASVTYDTNGVARFEAEAGGLIFLNFAMYGTTEGDFGFCWAPGITVAATFELGISGKFCVGTDGQTVGWDTSLGYATAGWSVEVIDE